MATQTSITSRPVSDGQKKAYRQLVENAAESGVALALEKVETDADGMQRVLEHGDELRTAILEAIVAKTRELSVGNQYADEEVDSEYDYLSGYTPKGIAEQVARLRLLFPALKDATYDESIAARPLPTGAEGWFAIPRFETVASMYGEAFEQILGLIATARNGQFTNYRAGALGPDRLRQTARSIAFWKKLGEEQAGHGILIVASQFGIRHRGRSVRRGREVYTASEFGLGSFAIGVMLLTHPERLQHYDDLWIDCAGDEYDEADSDVRFGHAPYFRFSGGEVKFGTDEVDDANGRYGTASAFLPQ